MDLQLGAVPTGRWEVTEQGTRRLEAHAPLSIVTDLKLRSSGLMPAAPSLASSCSFTGCFCAILQLSSRSGGTAEGLAGGQAEGQRVRRMTSTAT